MHEISKEAERTLHELGRSICDRERTIELLKGKTGDFASQAVAEALLQGQELLKAKEMVPHGLWLPWLKANCPTVHERMARRYMTLAANRTRVSELAEASSLRAALVLLCDGEPEHEGAKPKRAWPEHQEGLYRFAKVLSFTQRHPIERWPDESRAKLREELLPVCRGLWPEKFVSPG